jgi:hypothetical protein
MMLVISMVCCIFTERDGKKGPPAGNKAKCNCTNTPHSRATRRKAKPNQKPQTHTRGKRQAWCAVYEWPFSYSLVTLGDLH